MKPKPKPSPPERVETSIALKTRSRISRFTIGRLYNLGNYEHIRYELTVDVAEGRSAAVALSNTLKLLKAVSPKPPVSSSDYSQAKSQLSDPQAWHKNIADKRERARAIKTMVEDAKNTVKKFEVWEERRRAAQLVLDNIGASTEFKDAKLSWGEHDVDWDY
jgi:hypothetical protein